MKLNKTTLLAFTALCSLVVSCSKEQPTSLNNSILQIDIFDAGINSQSRATTSDEYVTEFADGDRVGLYAVKDGAIASGIKNIILSYNGATWTMSEKIKYDASMVGVTYYAYYPYDAAAVFNPSDTDPFGAMISAWQIDTDLSDAEVYSLNDLMTGSSQGELANGKYILNLALSHKMGMVSIELPSTHYTFTNTDAILSNYAVSTQGGSFAVSMNDGVPVAVSPYYEETSNTYRMLVKPSEKCAVAGTFTVGGKAKKYTVAFNDGIAANTYEPYMIDGGLFKTTMELKVGDYFCADGTLVSYSADGNAPLNAIGVIYNIGTTAAIKADNSSCDHALVYAIKRAPRATVETDTYDYGEDEYLARFGTAQAGSGLWYTTYGISEYASASTSTILGYQDTKGWMSITPEETLVSGCIVFQQTLNAYRNSSATKLPSATTNWYLPSYKEITMLNDKSAELNASLAKITSGEALLTGVVSSGANDVIRPYLSSTARNATSVLGYTNASYTTYLSARYGYFRFAFAF